MSAFEEALLHLGVPHRAGTCGVVPARRSMTPLLSSDRRRRVVRGRKRQRIGDECCRCHLYGSHCALDHSCLMSWTSRGPTARRKKPRKAVVMTSKSRAKSSHRHEECDADADGACADEAEQEERPDRRHDREVRVVVLLRMNRADEQDRDSAEVARGLGRGRVTTLAPKRLRSVTK